MAMNLIFPRSVLVLVAALVPPGSLAAQGRQLPSSRSTIQVLRLTPVGAPTRMTGAVAPAVAEVTADQKVQMARDALGTARAVHGAEAPIRITAATPRIPSRAWIMLNNATLIAGDGAPGSEEEFRLGGESSYLRINLSLPQPSQPHLLQCLVQGKPGVTTVMVRAGTTSMQTSVQPGWQHVGWLLWPEGAGHYAVEIAPGPHYLLEVRYCEITPLN